MIFTAMERIWLTLATVVGGVLGLMWVATEIVAGWDPINVGDMIPAYTTGDPPLIHGADMVPYYVMPAVLLLLVVLIVFIIYITRIKYKQSGKYWRKDMLSRDGFAQHTEIARQLGPRQALQRQ